MPFANYNGVVQTTPNSCGAFALAAALDHIGVANIMNVLDTANLANGFTQPGPQAFAQSIYQVTGCLDIDFGALTATYQYQAPVADTNPPSALAYMAVQSGAAAGNVLIRYNNAAFVAFAAIAVLNAGGAGNLLATEINLINAPAFGNVVGPINYLALPAPGEAHLLLVSGNTHWIAINNLEVYDPATGFVGPYVVNAPLPLVNLTYVMGGMPHPYVFDGVWISLT
jgi:hypothetical protein